MPIPIEGEQTSQKKEGEQTGQPATSAGDGSQPPVTKQQQPAPSQQQQASDGKTFDQDSVNQMVGQARTEARDRLLKDLGFENAEALKTLIKQQKDAETANMTELQKAQAEVQRLGTIEQSQKVSDESLLAANKSIKTFVEAQMKTMEIPDHVTPLIDAMPLVDRLSYLTEHGAEFTTVSTGRKSVNTNASGKGTSDTKTEEKARREGIKRRYSIY